MTGRNSFQLAKPGILGEVIYPVAPVLNLAVMGDDLIVGPITGALIAGIAFVSPMMRRHTPVQLPTPRRGDNG
jgi:hypothetical protein